MADNNQADILSKLEDIEIDTEDTAAFTIASAKLLDSIDKTLKQIAQNGGNMSAANARNAVGGYGDIRSVFRDRNASRGIGGSRSGNGFVDGLEDALIESVLGSDYKDKLKNVMNTFAEEIGVSVKDIPNALGRELGNQLLGQFKNTQLGKDVFGRINQVRDEMWSRARSSYRAGQQRYTDVENGQSARSNPFSGLDDLYNRFRGNRSGSGGISNMSTDQFLSRASESGGGSNFLGRIFGGGSRSAGAGAAEAAASATETAETAAVLSEGAAGAGAALSGLGEVVAAFQPEILAAMAAMVALEVVTEKLKEAMKPAVEGIKNFGKVTEAAWDRENNSRERYAKLAADRLKADIKTMIETPFTILEDAAKKVYTAWDNTIGIINQTQGYTKADLQSLMGSFSARLQSEGLDKVIASTDIVSALENTLKSGLSGKVAEEFAYQAAKLNAEIPTQDFFNYAATYSSIAANAIKNGKSQSEAISLANQQLEAFASNVLYAGRQLSGGFSTGLQNAQDLFEKSVKISQAARTGDATQISGVLTSVSAIVGAIAPDLASGIVDTVYQAAVGGNKNSSLVALRSLAGINASNTEFLRQLATNPQQIFSALFSKLSTMQNMSDAYMETSEGLADLFGMNVDAFARVDFNYLAEAISQMNTNNASLSENIALLASGESTTSAEQMRIQKINEYLIDEGLALVLDNEAARVIQQHMWDEQLAQQITEAEYAVNLQGSALQALEGIHHTIDNILAFLNPLAWGKRLGNLIATAVETQAQDADIRNLLEVGKVGNGNVKALRQLTTRGVKQNVVESLLSMYGSTSLYSGVEGLRRTSQFIANLGLGTGLDYNINNRVRNELLAIATQGLSYDSSAAAGPSSKYKWGTMSKSAASALFATGRGTAYSGTQATEIAKKAAKSGNIERMIATLSDFVDPESGAKKNDRGYYYTYEDWADTAKRYGIADLGKALEGAGYSEQQIKEYFQDATTKSAAEEEVQRRIKEETSWDTIIAELPIIDANGIKTNELLDLNNQILENIFTSVDDFHDKWVEYVYDHEIYDKSYSASDVEKIKKAVKESESDTAVQKLANILTQNTTDLTDPQVQGNALLAEILKVILVIMNQNNNKTSSDQLKDSLNALALGLTG